jgi:hypothetical protein
MRISALFPRSPFLSRLEYSREYEVEVVLPQLNQGERILLLKGRLDKGFRDYKKRMGVWKLSVFRPERKNDSGEFIPLAL